VSCSACGHDNPAGNRFCGGCGASLERRCPACQHASPSDHRFCGACGATLEAPSHPPRDPSRGAHDSARTPRAYTPKHLAEKILQSKSALEGERKQVTVLFADLKGSMELLADRDPEEARKLLDPVLERMMEAVHRYEGTVNQVMGDGIMAFVRHLALPRALGSRGRTKWQFAGHGDGQEPPTVLKASLKLSPSERK
jgi:hypothetical protein